MKDSIKSMFSQYSKPKKIILALCIVMLVFSIGINCFLLFKIDFKKEEKVEEVEKVNRLQEVAESKDNYLAKDLIPQLAETITSQAIYSDTWAFAIIDTETNTMASWNSHPMCSASIIKQYIMATMYEEENWKDLMANYDEDYVQRNIRGMIVMSDNDCANTCINILGMGDTQAGIDKVNVFTKKYGYNQTRLDHPFYSEGNPEIDNLTSAIDNALFQYDLLNNRYERSEDMINLLKDQYWTHKIPAGLPRNVETTNKTGDLWNCENDCAIVWSDNGTYIISIMSDGLANFRNARRVINNLSSITYKYFMDLDRTALSNAENNKDNMDLFIESEPLMTIQGGESGKSVEGQKNPGQ